MSQLLTKKVRRVPYEFERDGPIVRKPSHVPDFSLSVTKNSGAVKDNISASTSSFAKERRVVLDTLFIVDVLGTSKFDEVTEIDGSSHRLNAVELAAIRELTAVQKADFSDNKLPLEPFAVMPALEELDLSCNSLKTFDYKSSEEMSGDDRAWSNLVTLNLAFNSCGQFITELQLIPRLMKLNLGSNGLHSLPSNMMHFTCLSYLDLSSNNLNSDSCFFSLATIPSLQTLILNDNGIIHVPKFQFGFEALTHLSLRNNKIEMAEDIESLADLEQLEDVDIIGNPLVLRTQSLRSARATFAGANIELKCDEAPPVLKHTLAGPLRTVKFDPLTVPSYARSHLRVLARKAGNTGSPQKAEKQKPKPQQVTGGDDDVFMTAFSSKAGDEYDKPKQLSIDPTPLPEPEEQVITSVWSEVPVVQLERRKQLTQKRRQDFLMAFRKLEYLVTHPDVRLKPRESTCLVQEEVEAPPEVEPDVFVAKEPVVAKTKKPVAQKLAARTEYTKGEIQNMLQSMEERLSVVERDLQVADESGQSAVDMALDQRNFANLHKQYETIRAELINTLNG